MTASNKNLQHSSPNHKTDKESKLEENMGDDDDQISIGSHSGESQSYNSHQSQGSSSARTVLHDEVEHIIAKEESKRVRQARTVMVLVLICMAIAACTVTYIVTVQNLQENFETQVR